MIMANSFLLLSGKVRIQNISFVLVWNLAAFLFQWLMSDLKWPGFIRQLGSRLRETHQMSYKRGRLISECRQIWTSIAAKAIDALPQRLTKPSAQLVFGVVMCQWRSSSITGIYQRKSTVSRHSAMARKVVRSIGLGRYARFPAEQNRVI